MAVRRLVAGVDERLQALGHLLHVLVSSSDLSDVNGLAEIVVPKCDDMHLGFPALENATDLLAEREAESGIELLTAAGFDVQCRKSLDLTFLLIQGVNYTLTSNNSSFCSIYVVYVFLNFKCL